MPAKKPDDAAQPETPEAEETIAMRHPDPSIDTLTIGTEEIAVEGGVAQVPARLFAAAHHAGFR